MTFAKPDYDRGPWWWRLRYWLSQRFLNVGGWLEPNDVTTVSWREYQDGKEYIIIDTARRR